MRKRFKWNNHITRLEDERCVKYVSVGPMHPRETDHLVEEGSFCKASSRSHKYDIPRLFWKLRFIAVFTRASRWPLPTTFQDFQVFSCLKFF